MFEWTSKWSRMPSLYQFQLSRRSCITDALPNNFSFFFVEQFPRRKQTIYPFYQDFYGKFRGAPTCLYVLRIAWKRTCARMRSIYSIGTESRPDAWISPVRSYLSIFSRARKIDRPDWLAPQNRDRITDQSDIRAQVSSIQSLVWFDGLSSIRWQIIAKSTCDLVPLNSQSFFRAW